MPKRDDPKKREAQIAKARGEIAALQEKIRKLLLDKPQTGEPYDRTEIIKIDADILRLQTKLREKESGELRARLDGLFKKRQQLLEQMEKKARERIQ